MWSWLMALLPVLVYFFTVYRFAVNQPYADDYDAILHFLVKYNQLNSFGDRFLLLFSQHNEHRILTSRIIYLLYYKMAGTINFSHLIFIANLQLIVIYFLLLSLLKQFVNRFWWVAPFFISLILFDLNAYENANWSMAGMQNYGVIMCFLLSLYFYSGSQKYGLFLALTFQFLSAFSSGNGMIAGFTLVLFNLLNRNKKAALLSSLFFFGTSILYFVDFYSPKVGHGAPIDRIIPFFLHSIGANFGFKVGVPGGLFLLTGLIYFFPIKGSWKLQAGSLPLLAILFFILASLAITAFFRAGISMEVSYSTRYFVYPHILLCIVFAFMLNGINSQKVLKIAVYGSVLGFIAIYTVSYRYGTAGFARIRQCTYDSNCYTDGSIPLKKKIAAEACAEGILCTDLPATPKPIAK
jgi:hypothetical protein